MLTRAAPLLLPPDQAGYAAHDGDGQHGDPRGDQRPMPPRPFGRPVGQRRPPGPDRLVGQEPLQVVGHLLGRGVTLRGSLAVAFSTIVSRSRGIAGLTACGRRRVFFEQPADQRLRGSRRQRRAAA